MPELGRREIPGLLLRMVPESRRIIEAAAGAPAGQAVSGSMEWFDLYDFLSAVFRGLLSPALTEKNRDDDLLARSFDFVETVLRSSNESVSGAGYFQVVEPLFGSEDLLVAAVPVMREETLRLTLSELDTERLSSGARAALVDYLT
ncbi:hypothetical protein [Streptomyces sp. NBC_01481]|uniref:hypothetical protein n=1 Tax=Streptomyces sp. NBC_01481 TaxID=2975869 RepID=UPI00225A4D46|nr:hypothetical protein [Streptomyces sp. NBC_01481]MCX4586540.1 hypothetical protein [Streptomyces sp. NBC_01481]